MHNPKGGLAIESDLVIGVLLIELDKLLLGLCEVLWLGVEECAEEGDYGKTLQGHLEFLVLFEREYTIRLLHFKKEQKWLRKALKSGLNNTTKKWMPTTRKTNPDGMLKRTKSIYVCVLAHLPGALSIGGMMLGGVMENICVQIKLSRFEPFRQNILPCQQWLDATYLRNFLYNATKKRIIMIDTITCPNCNHTFNTGELLSKQIEEELQQKIAQEKSNSEKEVAKIQQKYEQGCEKVKAQEQAIEQQIKQGTEQILQKERTQMQVQIQQEQARLQAQNAAQLQAQREEIEKIIETKTRDAYELKIKEQKVQMERLEKALQEANRVAQPTISQQLQGEVQELAIEEYLRNKFPLDSIQEVPKGQRGSDCLHIVRDDRGQDCGVICYESKRAKNFNEEWVEKLTQNKRESGAHLAVLVSANLPSSIERMGLYKGVYICTFQEFKGLCGILREMILNLARVQKSQEDRGGKIDKLYNYLVSPEFAKEVENAIAIFSAMQNSVNEEKRLQKTI